MPASTLHPMTEVAKPVMHWAAVRAQAGEFAVITTRAARMSKASANVSTTRTPPGLRSRGSCLHRFPDEYLSLAWNRGVAGVALVRSVPFFVGNGKTQR